MKLLLKHGVNINSPGPKGWTFIIFMSKVAKINNNCHNIILLLLKLGADKSIQDKWGNTLYDYAKRKPQVINVLQEYQSEFNQILETKLPPNLVDIISEY